MLVRQRVCGSSALPNTLLTLHLKFEGRLVTKRPSFIIYFVLLYFNLLFYSLFFAFTFSVFLLYYLLTRNFAYFSTLNFVPTGILFIKPILAP